MMKSGLVVHCVISTLHVAECLEAAAAKKAAEEEAARIAAEAEAAKKKAEEGTEESGGVLPSCPLRYLIFACY